jgi:hypothetical protein
MYTRRTHSTNYHNKYLYGPSKLYELPQQILETTKTKYLFVPSKLYIVRTNMYTFEQILQTTKIKYLYIPNKLYELSEQICIHVE